MLNFKQKINTRRSQEKITDEKNLSPYELVQIFESDRGRVVNSAAVRRLQQKTQVFPLERNSVVRSRLTHSMEVQQVGRHIVKAIVERLREEKYPYTKEVVEYQNIIESLVEMACLMHDIGNPPFGHFGEKAINTWFEKRLGLKAFSTNLPDSCEFSMLCLPQKNLLRQALCLKVRQDLCHFEGNAQAIRMVHSLLKLNLTYTQIACILKYTAPAYWYGDKPEQFSYLMKKPGFYLAEESFVKDLQSILSLEPYHRFPLTYIMEAADDISYCIADLEDAVEKGILTVEQLYHYLELEWKKGETASIPLCFEQTVKKAYLDYLQIKQPDSIDGCEDQFFIFLRVNTIRLLVDHAVERFIENMPAIMEGSFNETLLEDHGVESKLLSVYKTIAFQYVFNHESVEMLELQGYRIITGLLDIYSPLLDIPMDDFLRLEAKNSHKSYLIETRLLHKLPIKYRLAYREAVNRCQHSLVESLDVWEFYYRCRLIQDYISGMTDHYAYDEYRKLMVAG